MSDQTDYINSLLADVNRLQERVAAYLNDYPSPRVSHHARGLSDLASALVVVRLGEKKNKERGVTPTNDARLYNAHEKSMAERLGITPAEFVKLQEERKYTVFPLKEGETIGDVRPDGSVVGYDLEPMKDPNDD